MTGHAWRKAPHLGCPVEQDKRIYHWPGAYNCSVARSITNLNAVQLATQHKMRKCSSAFDHLATHRNVEQMYAALDNFTIDARAGSQGFSPSFERESWLNHASKGMRGRQPSTICEVGLNLGHSAVAWLCGFPSATYISLDLMATNGSQRALAFVRAAFPGRVRSYPGDSMRVLPQIVREGRLACDIWSIDGGHRSAQASSDLRSAFALSRAGGPSLVIMDDLRCGWGWCAQPTQQWERLRLEGSLHERGCFIFECCVGWCWGEFNTSDASVLSSMLAVI
jgi:hypothetical protein